MAQTEHNPPSSDLALASLAVLNVNWHSNASSYLDGFAPFVIEAVRSASGPSNANEVVSTLRKQFGLSIPHEVVNSIAGRAVKNRALERAADGRWRIAESENDSGRSLSADLSRLLREQRDLELALSGFALSRFSLDWAEEQSSAALIAYIHDNSARMLASDHRGPVPFESFESSESQRVIVAAFIADLEKAHPTRFDYLINVAKGSFLATTLFFQNHFDPARKFKDTSLYLDTGVLLDALGYQGASRQAATLEWIELAQDQLARIACLRTTLREATAVVHYAASQIKAGRGWTGRPGSVLAYFYEEGFSLGVIDAEASSIEAKLKQLRVSVEEMPDTNRQRHLQIDEEAVEKVLDEGPHPYVSTSARRHDARALAAMVALRNSSDRDRLEDSRAVFVSLNYRVVNAARKAPDLSKLSWPTAMHVNDLAVLLWIKTRSKESDLPEKQLLATCLAILRPSERTWTKYITEMDALRSRGILGATDVALIAQRNEVDRASLIDRIQPSGTFAFKSPEQLLSEAKQVIEGPISDELQATVDQLRSKVDELSATRSELGSASAQAQLALAELNNFKRERTRSISRTAKFLAILLCTASIVLVAAIGFLLADITEVDLLLVIGAVAAILQLLALVFPLNQKTLFAKLTERIIKRLSRQKA